MRYTDKNFMKKSVIIIENERRKKENEKKKQRKLKTKSVGGQSAFIHPLVSLYGCLNREINRESRTAQREIKARRSSQLQAANCNTCVTGNLFVYNLEEGGGGGDADGIIERTRGIIYAREARKGRYQLTRVARV